MFIHKNTENTYDEWLWHHFEFGFTLPCRIVSLCSNPASPMFVCSATSGQGRSGSIGSDTGPSRGNRIGKLTIWDLKTMRTDVSAFSCLVGCNLHCYEFLYTVECNLHWKGQFSSFLIFLNQYIYSLFQIYLYRLFNLLLITKQADPAVVLDRTVLTKNWTFYPL